MPAPAATLDPQALLGSLNQIAGALETMRRAFQPLVSQENFPPPPPRPVLAEKTHLPGRTGDRESSTRHQDRRQLRPRAEESVPFVRDPRKGKGKAPEYAPRQMRHDSPPTRRTEQHHLHTNRNEIRLARPQRRRSSPQIHHYEGSSRTRRPTDTDRRIHEKEQHSRRDRGPEKYARRPRQSDGTRAGSEGMNRKDRPTYVVSYRSPLTRDIQNNSLPYKFKMLSTSPYDGKGDLQDHLDNYVELMNMRPAYNKQRARNDRDPFPLIPKFTNFTQLTIPYDQVYTTTRDKRVFTRPPPMRSERRRRDPNRYCLFHRDIGHDTPDCQHLKNVVEDLVRKGHFREYVLQTPQQGQQLGGPVPDMHS